MAKEVSLKDYTVRLGGDLSFGFRKEVVTVRKDDPAGDSKPQGFLGIAWTRQGKTSPSFVKTEQVGVGLFWGQKPSPQSF